MAALSLPSVLFYITFGRSNKALGLTAYFWMGLALEVKLE
jgi:hypothetical protein